MPVRVKCPSCGRGLQVPERLLGKPVKCPGCGKAMTIAARTGTPGGARHCPSCGAELGPDAVLCTGCGFNTKTGRKLTTDVEPEHPEEPAPEPAEAGEGAGSSPRKGGIGESLHGYLRAYVFATEMGRPALLTAVLYTVLAALSLPVASIMRESARSGSLGAQGAMNVGVVYLFFLVPCVVLASTYVLVHCIEIAATASDRAASGIPLPRWELPLLASGLYRWILFVLAFVGVPVLVGWLVDVWVGMIVGGICTFFVPMGFISLCSDTPANVLRYDLLLLGIARNLGPYLLLLLVMMPVGLLGNAAAAFGNITVAAASLMLLGPRFRSGVVWQARPLLGWLGLTESTLRESAGLGAIVIAFLLVFVATTVQFLCLYVTVRAVGQFARRYGERLPFGLRDTEA